MEDVALVREDDAEEMKKRIRNYDQLYAQYQQQGKPFEALEYLERGLFLRKELLGADHPEVSKVCQVFTTSCNTLAMNSLQRDNFMLAYELLKKAEILSAPGGYISDKKTRMKLRAVTFNNFGCFYKRRGKLHAALQYLAKALKIELNSQEVDNPAGTHLNLCATLSQLKRHGPALEHAQCALQLLQASPEARGKNEGASILAIAWHNLAVEQEHLSLTDAAIASYRQAVLVAEKEWGANHIKTLAIKHSYEEALAKAKQRMQSRRETSSTTATSSATGLLDGLINPRRSPTHATASGKGKGKKKQKQHQLQYGSNAQQQQQQQTWGGAGGGGDYGLDTSNGMMRGGIGSGGGGGEGTLPALDRRSNNNSAQGQVSQQQYMQFQHQQADVVQQLPSLSNGSPRRGPRTPEPEAAGFGMHFRPGRKQRSGGDHGYS